MPQLHRFILHPLTARVFLGTLAVAYLLYLATFVHLFTASTTASSISEHSVKANPTTVLAYWTASNMRSATDADTLVDQGSTQAQGNSDTSQGKAAQQTGQPPSDSSLKYPFSTVGKVFLTNAGRNLVCSGTAVISNNKSVVDTAGHCLYWQGGWAQNVIFCPLYENGNTPLGCWAARDLEVPADWISLGPSNLHHDFGMAIVAPNNQGALTDVVGGVGWAYNQPINKPFYAYGYPAAPPFDG